MTQSDSLPRHARHGVTGALSDAQRLVDESGRQPRSLTWHVQAQHYGDLSVLAAAGLRAAA